MDYKHLLEEVKEYVTTYFNSHEHSKLVYHNLNHTQDVVKATMQIANHYQLSDQDFFVVTVGAWFHDLGYFENCIGHEQIGADLAISFLHQQGVSEEVREMVKQVILATQMPQKPNTLLEKILCDGDLFHLGTPDFINKRKLMHEEVALLHQKKMSKNEWRKIDIAFLESQTYHTDYCALLLNDQKLKNMMQLKEKLNESESKSEDNNQPDQLRKRGDNERPNKGIETMFRITSTNNQRLSDMADNKAQLLITVNSIILSLIVSLVLRRLEDNAFLIIPTFILLSVSLSTIIFSILATRPSIPEGVFTPKDLELKKVNLLFFGNFYKMSLPEYADGMVKVMNDKAFLYGTLINDVYSQGVVLGRKYKLIRIAYNIFMFGLIAAVLAYVMAYVAYGKLN